MSTTTKPDVFHDLRSRMRGTIVLPGDDDYDAVRSPWNLAVQQRPAAVAFPADVDDVRGILAAAAASGLGVTVQPNGHGASDDLDGVVLIRPRSFDQVSINVDGRSARVGAGVDWGRVLTALDGTGLIALAGSNPAINAVAYTLGGGHSLFARAFGLASESVSAIELVDASGEQHRVTADSDAELFWALRGGGGAFGVVTAIEFDLHPTDRLYGGTVMFPIEFAAATFAAGIRAAELDEHLGVDIGLSRFPDLPVVPPSLRGQTLVSIAIVHLGDAESAVPVAKLLRAVAPPVMDSLSEFGIGSLAAVAAEPTDPMPTIDWGGTFDSVQPDTVDALITAFLTGADLGLARLSTRLLGGRVAERTDALLGSISAPALVGAGAVPTAAVGADASLQPVRDLHAEHRGSGMIPTFLGSGSTLADAFDAESIDRLRAVKKRVDPHDLIRSNRAFG